MVYFTPFDAFNFPQCAVLEISPNHDKRDMR